MTRHVSVRRPGCPRLDARCSAPPASIRPRCASAVLSVVLALGLAVAPGLARAGTTAPGEFAGLAALAAGADGNERRKAAEALGAYALPEAVEVLARTYRAEARDAFGVRAACVTSLGKTGRAEAAGPLAEALGDPDYWVRRKAAEALGLVPGAAATEALRRALGDPDIRVRAQALIALGPRGPAGIEAARAALGDPDERLAAAALEALAAAGDPGAGAALTAGLGHPSPAVSLRAGALLARRGDPRGLAHLAAAVRGGRSGGVALREAAGLGAPAVPTLVALFADPGAGDRERVMDALAGVDAPASTAFLAELALARSADPGFRERAAMVLYDRRGSLSPNQIQAAAALVGEADPNLAAVGLQLQLEVGGGAQLGRIAPLARHDNPVVRHFALANLVRYGGPEQEPALVGALTDANGANVRLALEGLARVGTPATLETLRRLAEDRLLRRYAQAAIEGIEARHERRKP